MVWRTLKFSGHTWKNILRCNQERHPGGQDPRQPKGLICGSDGKSSIGVIGIVMGSFCSASNLLLHCQKICPYCAVLLYRSLSIPPLGAIFSGKRIRTNRQPVAMQWFSDLSLLCHKGTPSQRFYSNIYIFGCPLQYFNDLILTFHTKKSLKICKLSQQSNLLSCA